MSNTMLFFQWLSIHGNEYILIFMFLIILIISNLVVRKSTKKDILKNAHRYLEPEVLDKQEELIRKNKELTKLINRIEAENNEYKTRIEAITHIATKLKQI